MTAIIIPKTLVVGFQKREGTFDGKLAFITYKKPDGSIFNETRFRNWINCPEILEFDNFPQTGFSLGKSVRHGGHMSSEVVNVRIYSTQIDAEFEITIENFLDIATYSNINRKFIEGNCVIGWKGTKIHLMSLEDPEYESVKKYSESLYTPKSEKTAIDLSKYKFGDIFTTNSKKYLIGKHLTFFGKHKISNIIKAKKFKQTDFVHIGDNEQGEALFDIKETFSDVYLFGVMSGRIDSVVPNENQHIADSFFQEVIILSSKDVELFAEAEEFGNTDVTLKYRERISPESWETVTTEISMKYIEIEERFSEFKATAKSIREITANVMQFKRTKNLNYIAINERKLPTEGKLWLSDGRIIEFNLKEPMYREIKISAKAVAHIENGKIIFKSVNPEQIPSTTTAFTHPEMKATF